MTSLIELEVDAEDRRDRRSDVHVVPAWGREHEMSMRCWCMPERAEDVRAVVVHRDVN